MSQPTRRLWPVASFWPANVRAAKSRPNRPRRRRFGLCARPHPRSSPPARNAAARMVETGTSMSKIDELSAPVAALTQRVAALESKPVAPPRKSLPAPRVEDEGASIFYPRSAIALPTSAEFVELRRIVDDAFPTLRFVARNARFADADSAEDRSGFETAFRFLATVSRV